jgi:hypothetical protein
MLYATPGQLWEAISPKVRNQLRKWTKNEPTVVWRGEERPGECYNAFNQTQRDLGTPVAGR